MFGVLHLFVVGEKVTCDIEKIPHELEWVRGGAKAEVVFLNGTILINFFYSS